MILVLSICQLVATFVLGVLVLLARSYAQEKGKNLATKEDIADITRRVEEVKAEHARQAQALEHAHEQLLKQADQTHQLSLAAIDRRLQAHQEAFAKCHDLRELAHDRSPEYIERMNGLRQWWLENCLYLAPDAAKAFNQARGAVIAYRALLDARVGTQKLEENWRIVLQAADVIAAAVQLPGIGTQSAQFLRLGADGQPSSATDGACTAKHHKAGPTRPERSNELCPPTGTDVRARLRAERPLKLVAAN